MDVSLAQIMKMRALGYSQSEIAHSLGKSQSAVSQRIKTIRKQAKSSENFEDAFWRLLIAAGGTYLLMKLFDELRGDDSL